MAFDLAKVDTPSRSIPQTTFNRETTLPRAPTDRPAKEVNAVIRRPSSTNNAEALAKILGVAGDVASNIVGDIKANKDAKDGAQAAFDFASGSQNPELFAKSRAYYQAWQLEGAKAKSLDIGQKAADKVQEVLSDPNSTEQDADAAIESVFHQETHDEKGNLLDFGTPDAKLTLGHSLAETKAKLMPAVHQFIRDRQNSALMGTTMDNMIVERQRGAPIGDPNAVKVDGRLASIDSFLSSAKPAAPQTAPGHILGQLSAPFKGFGSVHLTGVMGDQRNGHRHNGEDFPVPTGTSIEAPMAGEVVASYNDTKHGGGESIRVKLANGAIVGFAHLSERHVQVGDQVNPGQLLGLSGQSGDATGPHVHMTVEVDGKKVSPRNYFASHKGDMVVETGAEPKLASGEPASVSQAPGLDVETFLSRLPPSISKSEGKTYFLQEAIAKAYQSGDPSLLNGLENSKRPDGTPSFNPEEQLKIEETRDQIRDQVTHDQEKAKRKVQGDNLDLVLNAYNSGHAPSDSWLAAQGSAGMLDPGQVYTLISHNRSMRKEAVTEARAEARANAQEAEYGIANDVNSIASAMMAGVPSALAVTDEQLRQQFQRGDFGPIGSRTAMAHYRTLMTARRQGVAQIEQSPDFRRYGAMLEQYKPLSLKVGDDPLLQQLNANPQGGARLDKPTYAEMTAFYKEQVDGGKSAGDAYRTAVDKYVRHKSASADSGPPQNAINRLSYLKCKQAGICK